MNVPVDGRAGQRITPIQIVILAVTGFGLLFDTLEATMTSVLTTVLGGRADVSRRCFATRIRVFMDIRCGAAARVRWVDAGRAFRDRVLRIIVG